MVIQKEVSDYLVNVNILWVYYPFDGLLSNCDRYFKNTVNM